ncbi:MAG: efflux RND transporter permease subunit, partial [Muribaculaceae bacterium]|nr:efflux RND transporter permease subunit [Muribaculaceae bacterium]
MLNRIIRMSLHNRLAVLVITALILIAGTAAILKTELDIFPDLNAPTVVVMTEAPGLAAEEVEKVVTFPLETAVNGATGVRRVRSTSTTGFSTVTVEFDWDTDIYTARQIVSERLDAASENLPDGVDKPVMGPQSSILGEMMIVGLTADSTSMLELRRIAERTIRPRLLALGGVSQVSVIGGDAPEYQIKLNPDRMLSYGISVADVLAATEGMNDNAGGGSIYDFGNEYIVKADINTTDCDELAQTVVRSDERGTVTLADIATVEMAGRLPRLGTASVATDKAVLITVTKQNGADTRSITSTIDAEMERMAKTLPADVKVSTDIFRQKDFIDAAIGNLTSSLAEGAFFVIIVLFIFLMNFRTTLISLIALPLSIIITVLIIRGFGMTVNTMSLGGIAIAIGCLVDDAIVDVENVYRRLRENRKLPQGQRLPAVKVVYEASAEVRMPIFYSTLIITAAFLPLFFLDGMDGRMLKPLGIAFIVALAASTIVALTLTPVLCSLLLDNDSKKEAALDARPRISRYLTDAYSRSLQWVLGHSRPVLWAVGVLFVAAAGLYFTLGGGFLPHFNEGSFTINVSTMPGISLEESDRIGRIAEQIILDTPEVITVARKTGRAELDEHSLGVNTSEMEVPYRLTDRSRAEVSADLRHRLSEIPGAVIEIGQPISHRIDAMLSGAQSQVAIKIFGPDLNTLFALGRDIKGIVDEVPGAVDVNIEQQVERPQLLITPRRELLARYGVTPGEFSRTISAALGGKQVGEVYDNGFAYDITVILDEAHRGDISSIGLLPVSTTQGPMPLENLADIRVSSGPNTINRENVERRLIVSAKVDARDLLGTVDDIRHRIDG